LFDIDTSDLEGLGMNSENFLADLHNYAGTVWH